MAPRRWQSLLLAASIVPAGLGAVLEKWNVVPRGWRSIGAASGETVTTFTVALHQKFDQLESLLLDVSLPGSKHYGQHWTKAEVDKAFHPNDDVIADVLDWLQSHGIKDYNIDGAFIDFATDIATANTLLSASYQYYENNGITKLRTLHYSIPDELQESIALITPGIYFGNTQKQIPMPRAELPTKTALKRDAPSKSTVDASCETSITPACLREMYNVGSYKADPKSGSRVSFGSFLNESALFSDLFQFEDVNQIPRQNFSTVSIANGTLTQDASLGGYGEANLDVQTIIGIAPGLPVVEYSTGGSP